MMEQLRFHKPMNRFGIYDWFTIAPRLIVGLTNAPDNGATVSPKESFGQRFRQDGLSKHSIDEIDPDESGLAKHVRRTPSEEFIPSRNIGTGGLRLSAAGGEEELDFIINYDIKYRMGKELEGEE